MAKIEPTAEDYEAAREEMKRPPEERAREIFFELEAKRQARLRVQRERADQRRQPLLRRLLPFKRSS